MKVEAAPTLFLITILAVVVLVVQVGAGNNSAATQELDRPGQPAIQLAGISLSGAPVEKGAEAQVALLRTPIGLEQTGLPQR